MTSLKAFLHQILWFSLDALGNLAYIWRAKPYPLKSSVGLCKCNRAHYQICTNINEAETFTSTLPEKLIEKNMIFVVMTNS